MKFVYMYKTHTCIWRLKLSRLIITRVPWTISACLNSAFVGWYWLRTRHTNSNYYWNICLYFWKKCFGKWQGNTREWFVSIYDLLNDEQTILWYLNTGLVLLWISLLTRFLTLDSYFSGHRYLHGFSSINSTRWHGNGRLRGTVCVWSRFCLLDFIL